MTPNSTTIQLLKDFIQVFVEQQIIANDYIIVLQDDLKYFQQKAEALNAVIKLLKNFRPCKLNKIS